MFLAPKSWGWVKGWVLLGVIPVTVQAASAHDWFLHFNYKTKKQHSTNSDMSNLCVPISSLSDLCTVLTKPVSPFSVYPLLLLYSSQFVHQNLNLSC